MAKDNYTPTIGLEKTKVAKWIEDKIRGAIKEVLEGTMDAEAEELICAKPYERSDERQDCRNGKRKRKLTTRVGEIELEVPRMRVLQFRTEVIERYRRMEISLEEAMIEMYLSGISTRRIVDVNVKVHRIWSRRNAPSKSSSLLPASPRRARWPTQWTTSWCAAPRYIKPLKTRASRQHPRSPASWGRSSVGTPRSARARLPPTGRRSPSRGGSRNAVAHLATWCSLRSASRSPGFACWRKTSDGRP